MSYVFIIGLCPSGVLSSDIYRFTTYTHTFYIPQSTTYITCIQPFVCSNTYIMHDIVYTYKLFYNKFYVALRKCLRKFFVCTISSVPYRLYHIVCAISSVLCRLYHIVCTISSHYRYIYIISFDAGFSLCKLFHINTVLFFNCTCEY